jgi:hypothetical protein
MNVTVKYKFRAPLNYQARPQCRTRPHLIRAFGEKQRLAGLRGKELYFHRVLSACRTRSSHSRIWPILLFVRLTRTVAARKERAVERSIAILPWLDNRLHLGANLRAKSISSAALLLSRASSRWIFSLERFFIASARAFCERPPLCFC